MYVDEVSRDDFDEDRPTQRFRSVHAEIAKYHEDFIGIASTTLRRYIGDLFRDAPIVQDFIDFEPPQLPSKARKSFDQFLHKKDEACAVWESARLALIDYFSLLSFLISVAKCKSRVKQHPSNHWLKLLEELDLAKHLTIGPDNKDDMLEAYGGFLTMLGTSWISNAVQIPRVGAFINPECFCLDVVRKIVHMTEGLPIYFVWTHHGTDITELKNYFPPHYQPTTVQRQAVVGVPDRRLDAKARTPSNAPSGGASAKSAWWTGSGTASGSGVASGFESGASSWYDSTPWVGGQLGLDESGWRASQQRRPATSRWPAPVSDRRTAFECNDRVV